ncbi:energy-coupling factor transporter transmembrane component T family protein [Paenibacillus agaridevorans]|uniref:energy-coupling factor transporter transmembrane component T family protein n=1 Tax=Paenibacillus agaridevorans TaxID=171404 RepID=UPI001BE47CCB|nr:energy-coupling factor transporter transmembrane component T [Paenibacillus agaridevorans]
MRTRMVFGRYIDRDSWIHRLDPRSKMTAMLLFMCAIFLTDSYAAVLVMLTFSLFMIKSTNIPLSYFARAVKPLLFIILFIVIFHLAFERGGARFIDVGPFAIYAGGLEKGLISAARMVIFVALAAMISFTTEPDRLTQGLGSMMKPLRAVGFHPEKAALMVGIALRFIPTIFEEAERIWKAQLSRGLDLTGKPLKQRARLILSLMVPVMAGAFRRAIDLADSMEARGYRLGAPRSAIHTLSWKARDTVFLLLFLVPLASVVVLSMN